MRKKENKVRRNLVLDIDVDKRVELYATATKQTKSDVYNTAASLYLEAMKRKPEVQKQLVELIEALENIK